MVTKTRMSQRLGAPPKPDGRSVVRPRFDAPALIEPVVIPER
jgi:hypothetical protein